MINFEDTSDEVQFADALESMLINSDSEEKEKTKETIPVKQEIKPEPYPPRFVPSACAPIDLITITKRSVGHTPTTQGGSLRRPPTPPGGIGRGSPLPPQDGAIGGDMPTTKDACKIAFNNSVDQFSQLQDQIQLFSRHMKQPFNVFKNNYNFQC